MKGDRLLHLVVVTVLLAVSAGLAISSLLGDSITYDETSHLTSGYSYLRTGDFRLAPDHPPLAKMWSALPLLFVQPAWSSPDTPGWREGDMWVVGRSWLFDLNDGERLLTAARCMMVVLLLGTCLSVYAMARRLFGASAALLALALAVLSPTLLAHGRLVTTDAPATLGMMLTLLAFSRLMRRITWTSWLWAALALSALSLTKFSWPVVLPALLLMAVAAVARPEPMLIGAIPRTSPARAGAASASICLSRRRHRVPALAAVGAATAVVMWAAIWSCYGWRFSPFRGADRDMAMMIAVTEAGRPAPSTMADAWETVLHDETGRPIGGPMGAFVQWARGHRCLPEAYLYGLAYTLKTTRTRSAYLMGRISNTGWRRYFPIAFVIKTPVPTMLLLVAGVAAVAARRVPLTRDPELMIGLVGFTAVYALLAVMSRINIGHRHLLPIYPAVLVFAGASASWARGRIGCGLIAAALAWLVLADARIHPHYVSYFNELIGGPGRGHEYLADSNIDWGQDLKRLAGYARAHPDEKIKLAYFGSGDPTRYGFECEMLPSSMPFGTPAEMTAGTYVVSVTQLLGVYEPTARDSFWQSAGNLDKYQALHRMLAAPRPATLPVDGRRQRDLLARAHDEVRRGRLLHQLRRRPPDQRIGYSLFVYRLSQKDVDALTRP